MMSIRWSRKRVTHEAAFSLNVSSLPTLFSSEKGAVYMYIQWLSWNLEAVIQTHLFPSSVEMRV